MEKLITVSELSDLTGIPEATLRFWRHKGAGPKSARIGRRIKYRESDVQAWFDQQFAQGHRDIGHHESPTGWAAGPWRVVRVPEAECGARVVAIEGIADGDRLLATDQDIDSLMEVLGQVRAAGLASEE